MSYAAFKLVHAPTGVNDCVPAFLMHPPPPDSSHIGQFPASASDSWGSASNGQLPNLVLVKGNLIEVYDVRVQEGDEKSAMGGGQVGSASVAFPAAAKRGGYMAGITAVWLEVACSYRLNGNVQSMAVLSHGRDGSRRRRDAIILTFRDAKCSVLQFDDATQKLKTSSLHYFEGPEWQHLRRGKAKFDRGPLIRADAQGRCAAVLIYDCDLVMMKAAQVGYGFAEEDETSVPGAIVCAHIESTYVVSLRDLDMKHIKDFVFLHGYVEPVIVVLHDKELTWAGRIAAKRDTSRITALSINTNSKQQPTIWSAKNLPYDAYKVLAVPAPIGGVLVVCANSLHYHSQLSSSSLALNELAAGPDGRMDMPRSSFPVELDAAHATWISHDVVLFTTKTGMLLVLSLKYDGRKVQMLELVKSRASVIASCICTIGDKLFFLGSRLGDSLLVQYTSDSTESNGTLKRDREEDEMEGDVMAPAAKKIRLEYADDVASHDHFSLYHFSSANVGSQMEKDFTFAVRDSLVNIGPLRDFACGSQNISEQVPVKQTCQELIACSGHGKNGGVSILSRSIRPELISQVDLPGCKGIWTVHHKSSSAEKEAEEEYHAYLIISLESRTMVLETGETLGEVTESVQYYTQGPTISAGNLFGRRRIAQVYPTGVRLLDGATETQDLKTEMASQSEKPNFTVAASFADPYIILQLADGSLQLVTGDADSCTLSISVPSGLVSSADPVTACTLYHDKGASPWLRRTAGDVWQTLGVPDPNFAFDQGDTYCIVCRVSGKLEIYELPTMGCVYSAEKFTYGLPIIFDARISGKAAAESSIASGVVIGDEGTEAYTRDIMSSMRIVQICMETWNDRYGRPFLFALLNDGTLLCYRAFCYEGLEDVGRGNVSGNTGSSSYLRQLRFARLQLDWEGVEDVHAEENANQKIVTFKDVGGLQGLFVTGSKPVWLMAFREQIRAHPQALDGAVTAFTSLHNVNCQHGLIYVTDQGVLKICQLPVLLNYDNDWPVQKIPLKGTPHQVTYYSEGNLYALVVSFPISQPLSVALPSIPDPTQSHQNEQPEAHDGDAMTTIDGFEIRFMKPSNQGVLWEIKESVKMQPTENVLAIRMVSIKDTTTEQMQNLLAIGTAYVQGEDVAARGRIVLVSVGAEAENLAKQIHSKEHKGAVSALASLQGHLLLAIGPKIVLHSWNGSELVGTAFFDAPLYVVSLNIVKNFVLFGDIHKSIYFLCWKEEGAQLVLLAKDFGSLDCYATEFLIDGSTLSLLVSDNRKNIQIFSYAPKSAESWKGQKLLPRVEFHVGSHVNKFLRMQMLPTASCPRSNRFALFFGTLDGSIAYVAPLEELTFRRLQTLQRKLIEAVPHLAGLNPRAFRQFRSDGEAHKPGPDNTVDSEQLRHFEMIPLDQQVTIARQIGTTRSHIISNIRDLSLSTNFF